MSRPKRIPGIKPSSKAVTSVDIAAMPAGNRLSVPVYIVDGANPGPNLVVMAANHGNEVLAVAGLLELFRTIDVNRLSGRITIVPVANPISFEDSTRSTWIDGLHDGATGNLSWIYPGEDSGFITRRIAWELTQSVLNDADFAIDLHGTVSGSIELCYGYVDDSDDDLSRTSRDLALAFGMNINLRQSSHARETGSQLGLGPYLRERNVPCVVTEIGHFYGLEADRQEVTNYYRNPIEMTHTGVLNVLRKLQMLDGELDLPRRQVIVSPERRCQAREGGLMVTRVRPRDIGRVFRRGDVLADVYSLATAEPIDAITVPFDQGLLFSAHTSLVCRLFPMEQAFHMADWQSHELIENRP